MNPKLSTRGDALSSALQRMTSKTSDAGLGSMVIAGEDVTLLNDQHFSRIRTTLGYTGWIEDALKDADFGKLAVRNELATSEDPTLAEQGRCDTVCSAQEHSSLTRLWSTNSSAVGRGQGG